MTIMKNLLGVVTGTCIFAMAAAQTPQPALTSTAPEPATSPSQAATPPAPATPPSAQLGPAPTVKLTFEMLDRNRDNVISRREAAVSPELSATFDQFDRNSDGLLDRSEFVSFARAP